MKNYIYSLHVILCLLLLNACEKESTMYKPSSGFITAANSSEAKSDGIITVQTGILPPVTQQMYIQNGSNSVTDFQISTSKHILIYQLFFSATYPLIQSVSINNMGSQPNAQGTITFNGSGLFINAGSGASLNTQVYYTLVDSATSGQTAQLKLTHIVYRTDDEVYHDFYPDNAGVAKKMCLVNNTPHISFQDPEPDTLPNGYKQIAVMKFKGDTSWALSDLPLHFASLYSGVIPKSNLIIKCNGKTIAKTDSVELNEGMTAATVVHFQDEFKHTAGKTELLRIFAPVTGFYTVIVTTMDPVSAFQWKDDFGVRMPGSRNEKFYKEQAGQSNYH